MNFAIINCDAWVSTTRTQITANINVPSYWTQIVREGLASVRDVLTIPDLIKVVDLLGDYFEKVSVRCGTRPGRVSLLFERSSVLSRNMKLPGSTTPM